MAGMNCDFRSLRNCLVIKLIASIWLLLQGIAITFLFIEWSPFSISPISIIGILLCISTYIIFSSYKKWKFIALCYIILYVSLSALLLLSLISCISYEDIRSSSELQLFCWIIVLVVFINILVAFFAYLQD